MSDTNEENEVDNLIKKGAIKLAENELVVNKIRGNVLEFLNENFLLLITQVQTCNDLLNMIKEKYMKDEKPDKLDILLLNSLQQRVQETIEVLLPLLRDRDSALPLLPPARDKSYEEEKIDYSLEQFRKEMTSEEDKIKFDKLLSFYADDESTASRKRKRYIRNL